MKTYVCAMRYTWINKYAQVSSNFTCSTHQCKLVVEQKILVRLKRLFGVWCCRVKNFLSKSVLNIARQGRVEAIKRFKFNCYTLIYLKKKVFYREFY